MTTLTIPLVERRLLQVVIEEAAAEPVHEWLPESLDLCLHLVRRIRDNTIGARQKLEQLLSDGVEASSFVQAASPLRNMLDSQIAEIQKSIDRLAAAEDSASRRLVAELRAVLAEIQALRELLSNAVALASRPPRPIDWERVRASEEAHARGETKPVVKR